MVKDELEEPRNEYPFSRLTTSEAQDYERCTFADHYALSNFLRSVARTPYFSSVDALRLNNEDLSLPEAVRLFLKQRVTLFEKLSKMDSVPKLEDVIITTAHYLSDDSATVTELDALTDNEHIFIKLRQRVGGGQLQYGFENFLHDAVIMMAGEPLANAGAPFPHFELGVPFEEIESKGYSSIKPVIQFWKKFFSDEETKGLYDKLFALRSVSQDKARDLRQKYVFEQARNSMFWQNVDYYEMREKSPPNHWDSLGYSPKVFELLTTHPGLEGVLENITHIHGTYLSRFGRTIPKKLISLEKGEFDSDGWLNTYTDELSEAKKRVAKLYTTGV